MAHQVTFKSHEEVVCFNCGRVIGTATGKLEKRLSDVIARNWQLERMVAEYEHTIKKLTEKNKEK